MDERLQHTMNRLFVEYVDGPVRVPPGAPVERELFAATEISALAHAFESAQVGLGVSFLGSLADDSDECGNVVPVFKIPHRNPGPLDDAVLAAALEFVAAGAASAEIAQGLRSVGDAVSLNPQPLPPRLTGAAQG